MYQKPPIAFAFLVVKRDSIADFVPHDIDGRKRGEFSRRMRAVEKKPLVLLIEPLVKKKLCSKFLTKRLPLTTSLKRTRIALKVTALILPFIIN